MYKNVKYNLNDCLLNMAKRFIQCKHFFEKNQYNLHFFIFSLELSVIHKKALVGFEESYCMIILMDLSLQMNQRESG